MPISPLHRIQGAALRASPIILSFLLLALTFRGVASGDARGNFPFPGDASSILTFLPAADVAGIRSQDCADRYAILQAAINTHGAGNLIWPDGLYCSGQTLVPANGQNWICGSQTYGSFGGKLATKGEMNAPLVQFNSSGAIKGCTLIGNAGSSQTAQSLVAINNTNDVTLDDVYFVNGYAGVSISGVSFYISIRNSRFGTQYRRYLDINGTVASAGVDLILDHVRFLGGASTMDYGWQLDGLGSIIANNIIMSVNQFTRAAVYFNRPASGFGGAQIANSVFETAGNGPSWILGNIGGPAWNSGIYLDNTILNGGSQAAVVANSSSRFRMRGGTIASTSAEGIIQIPANASFLKFLFSGTAFDGTGGETVFRCGSGAMLSGSIMVPEWGGFGPIVDFRNTTANNIAYLDTYGGSLGISGTPYRLPAGRVHGTREGVHF
jgi:hypothetical protein